MRILDRNQTAVLLIWSAPILVIFLAAITKHQRVGDGMEYIAMFYAWKDTLRPYLTNAVAIPYDALYHSGAITDMLPFKWVQDAFPAYRLGVTQDVNHFWFYSAVAALFSKVIGFKDPTYSFAAFHAFLAFLTVWVGKRIFGLAGALTAFCLIFLSPMLWFVNKIHTEFFTVTLCMIAVFGLIGNRFTWSLLALATASTQNPSFAIVAVAVGLVWWLKFPQPSRSDILLAVFSGIITCLHPLYYFFRFGALTPQLMGYGAKFSAANLLNSYVWFIDPDIGLFPNWKASILIIAIAWIAMKNGARLRGDKTAYVLMGILFAVNVLAQSATVNINSGGTRDIARYALWYLPLFVPLVLMLAEKFVTQTPHKSSSVPPNLITTPSAPG